MKTKLGILGTLICSAGLLALPAMAESRGNSGNYHTQVYNQTSARTTQAYAQRYTATETRRDDGHVRYERKREQRRHEHDRRDRWDWR